MVACQRVVGSASCMDEASHWVISPAGRRVAIYCRKHAEETRNEYLQKMVEVWFLCPIENEGEIRVGKVPYERRFDWKMSLSPGSNRTMYMVSGSRGACYGLVSNAEDPDVPGSPLVVVNLKRGSGKRPRTLSGIDFFIGSEYSLGVKQ